MRSCIVFVIFNNSKATRCANLAVLVLCFFSLHCSITRWLWVWVFHDTANPFWKQTTAFGGNKVLNLLEIIERRHQRFKEPPIGPIGAHLVI